LSSFESNQANSELEGSSSLASGNYSGLHLADGLPSQAPAGEPGSQVINQEQISQ